MGKAALLTLTDPDPGGLAGAPHRPGLRTTQLIKPDQAFALVSRLGGDAADRNSAIAKAAAVMAMRIMGMGSSASSPAPVACASAISSGVIWEAARSRSLTASGPARDDNCHGAYALRTAADGLPLVTGMSLSRYSSFSHPGPSALKKRKV